jgi:hypothetical protein
MSLLSTIRKIENAFAKQEKETQEYISNNEETTEESFGGVPLSALVDLASGIYRGVSVINDSGILDFIFTSRSGKKKRHAQYIVGDDGKLDMISNYYYENEYRNSADEFLHEANERFTFSKDE